MKICTLVLCDDTWHPAATVRRGLAAFAGDFSFEFLEDGAVWSAERMNDFPVTVLAKANITSSKIERPWLTAETAAAFPDYVRRGNGLLVVHAGSSRYEELPAMNALLGGAFVRHPAPCAVTLEPAKPHPMMEGVKTLTVHDEHYFMAMSGVPVDAFLLSRSEHGEQPAGWTRPEGAGRVCVLTPGHSVEVWMHPSFQKLLFNALCWTSKLN
jgi:type 1 glutamine amidotransferase